VVFCDRIAQEASTDWPVSSYLCSCWFFRHSLSSSIRALAPWAPSCCITTDIIQWSQDTNWFSLLYILNMDEDVIITLSVLLSIANLTSNNSYSLPGDCTAT